MSQQSKRDGQLYTLVPVRVAIACDSASEIDRAQREVGHMIANYHLTRNSLATHPWNITKCEPDDEIGIVRV